MFELFLVGRIGSSPNGLSCPFESLRLVADAGDSLRYLIYVSIDRLECSKALLHSCRSRFFVFGHFRLKRSVRSAPGGDCVQGLVGARVHQHEAARAVRVLDQPGCVTHLSEQRGLLIARDAGDGDTGDRTDGFPLDLA
jgi:hypothetical protein